MSTENTGSVIAAVEGDGVTVEVELQPLSEVEALALMHPNLVLADLPDLVPHSGENFGKPSLTGDSK
jgi:hypothetical protein